MHVAKITVRRRGVSGDTDPKDRAVCTVDNSPVFNYNELLEPPQERSSSETEYEKNSALQQCIRQVVPGELFVKARGGEIVFAAGYVSYRSCLEMV